MNRDLALLRLLQLFDSQFPVGAFAHSGGIETFAARGAGLAQLAEILRGQIDLGWGRSELGGAHLAWRAADDATLERLAWRLDALKVVPAVRDASTRLGQRTLHLLRRLYPEMRMHVPTPHHALVIGTTARALDLDIRDVLVAYGHSLAIGTLTAAVRCMPVSPAQAQELLIEAQAPLGRAVERALEDPDTALFTCTPALDIRSHQQAFLQTRLFQS